MLQSIQRRESSTQIEILNESDVYAIAKYAKEQAEGLGFTTFSSGLISIAASEIAMNVVRYGVRGTALIQYCENDKGIEIHIFDQGSGIPDIELAMQDGYSTTINSGLGLGLGLGAAKRSVDEMIIDSTPQGTSITLRKYLSVPRENIDTGMVSFPAVGEHIKCDAYFAKGYEGDKLIAAVCEGRGTKGEHSALVIQKLLQQHYQLPLDELIRMGHQKLQEDELSQGVDIALFRITPSEIESTVMGNVSIHADLEPEKRSLSTQNACLGLSIPEEIPVYRTQRPETFCYVLHSDGITNVDYPLSHSIDASAQYIAEKIFDQHAVCDDDATVVVLKG